MRRIQLAVLILSCLHAVTAKAWDQNGTPIRTGDGTVEQLEVVSDGAGGSYVGWADRRSSNYDVYLSRRNANGVLVAGWTAGGNPVASGTGDQKSPRLLPDGSGGVYVCWQDSRNAATGFDIYVARYDAGGALAAGWVSGGLALCNAAGAQTSLSLTSTSDGNIAIAWLDYRSTGVPVYYAQKLSPTGSPMWATNGVPVSNGYSGISTALPASIASDGFGGVYVGFAVGTPTPKGYVQRLAGANGSAYFPSAFMVSASSVSRPPSLAPDGANGVIAAYAVDGNIVAARINNADTPVWVRTLCSAAGDQLAPLAVPDGNSGAHVAWGDKRNTDRTDLYAQHVTAGGTIAAGWEADGRLIATAIAPISPTGIPGNGLPFGLATSGGTPAGARIAWVTAKPGDVFGRVVDGSGTLGTLVRLCQDVPIKDQNSPVVTNTTSGGVVVWRDERPQTLANSGIYGGALDFSGCTASVLPGAVTNGASDFPYCYAYHLTWTPPSDGVPVDEYVVTNLTVDPPITYPTVMYPYTHIDIPNLQPGTTYNFSVVARNCVGQSQAATTLSRTTLSGCPNQPTNVRVTTDARFPSAVYVAWDYTQGISPASGLRIYSRLLGESATAIRHFSNLPAQGSGNVQYSFNIPAFEGEVAVVPYISGPSSEVEYFGNWTQVRTPETPEVPLASEQFLLDPRGNEEYATSIPFYWEAGRNCRTYDLEIASSSAFDPSSAGYQLITDIQPQAPSYLSYSQPVTGLDKNLLYYARLRGQSRRGEVSGWGDASTFQLLGFRMTAPTTAVTWQYGEQRTVQWAPGSTVVVDLYPNPTIVDGHLAGSFIRLSGGVTGSSFTFAVPFLSTTQARIQLTRTVAGASEYAYSPAPITITIPAGNGNAVKVGPGVVEQAQVVADGQGGSYVCWSDASNGVDKDVFVARLTASGTTMAGWPVNITPGRPGDQFGARLVADGAGGVYVAWQQGALEAGADVYAIRLNASAATATGWGASAPGYGGIAVSNSVSSEFNPAVALASDNSLLVGWNDTRNVYSLVYAQKLSPAGQAQWTAGGVQASGSNNEPFRPAILSDGQGGAYLTYVNGLSRGFVQRLLPANGARALSSIGSELPALVSNYSAPALVSDGGTGVIVAHAAIHSGSADIEAVRIDAVTPANNWWAIVCNASGDQLRPAIVSDGARGAVVAWQDERVAGSHARYAMRLLATGVAATGWPSNGVQVASSTYPIGAEESPGLVSDGAGGSSLSWAALPGDIVARRVSACGSMGALSVVCNDGLEQNAPVVAATGAGAATVVWRDARGAGVNTGVFAAAIEVAGPVAPSFTIASGTNVQMLQWTGPAADVTYGAPASFEIRTSSAPINASNWDAATTAAIVGVTGPAGTPYCVTIPNLSACQTYHYALRALYPNCGTLSVPFTSKSHKTKCSGSVTLDCGAALVYEAPAEDVVVAAPRELAFSRPMPNPARDLARFELAIPTANQGDEIRLAIYDLLGRRVRQVLHESARVGRQRIEWRLDDEAGARVPSGVYYARLSVGRRVFTRTVIAQP